MHTYTLRKKPTPSSLNLTKTTYENPHRSNGCEWFYIDNDGEMWITNDHVAMRDKPKYPGIDEYIGVYGWTENTSTKMADAVEGNWGDALQISVLHTSRSPKGEGMAVIGRYKGGVPDPITWVQAKYAELILWMYPGCTFHSIDPTGPIQVRLDGDAVAYVMPCRM